MSTTETSPDASAASDTGSQLTAENQAADIEGATLVYRRFGNAQPGQAPLLCLQHFRGNLDFWDQGHHDPYVPPANGRYLDERLPNSSYHELDSGHFFWDDANEEFSVAPPASGLDITETRSLT
jgi:hypothetical protein